MNIRSDSRYAAAAMPPHAPLPMPLQSFSSSADSTSGPDSLGPKRDKVAPRIWRGLVFGSAIGATVLLTKAVVNWLSAGDLSWVEILIGALVGVTLFWIALSLATALAGLASVVQRRRRRPQIAAGTGARKDMSVALLIPVYNEAPWDVFGNAAASLAELAELGHDARYSLYVLSDTRDASIAAQEWRAYEALAASCPPGFEVYYRRRAENTDRKTGNLKDWVENWGARHDAMVVLDADSLMSGRGIQQLVDAMADDPEAGLIQSCPRLIWAETLFGRIQQFANVAYGSLLFGGLSLWTDREGNYWGHNAIIRTKAFASCAGLPYLRSIRGKEQLIWSHDFVEASLLRRAGWSVRLLTDVDGTYEETPASLIDHVLRDRRWCQGNLQHLRLLASAGFHPVSRFHLFHGAVSYLMSPVWFVLLVTWALLGNGPDANVINYFSAANPLYPVWPETAPINGGMFMALTYLMLLAPKFVGAVVILFDGKARKSFGGGRLFTGSFIVEMLAAILYAPVLMVQQTVAVLRATFGLHVGWTPQNRGIGTYSLGTLVKFHALETTIGVLLIAGIGYGLVSIWLVPVAVSLVLAVPLSALSQFELARHAWLRGTLATPEFLKEPKIMSMARDHRERLRTLLRSDPAATPPQVAAE